MKYKLIQLAIFTLLSLTLNAQITWEKVIIPDSLRQPTDIIEIEEDVLILSSTQGIIKSIDNGENWYRVSYTGGDDIAFNHRNDILYTSNLISYDFGETWIDTNVGYFMNVSILSNNSIVLSTDNLILKMSPDGSQVDTLYNPMETYLRFCKVVEDNNGYLYTGTYAPLGGGGIYRSDDFGESWNIISWDSVFVFDLAVGPDNALYAARFGGWVPGNGGAYKSEDNGLTWTPMHYNPKAATAIVVLPDNTIYIGVDGYYTTGGVYEIKPDGTERYVNDGLEPYTADELYLSPTNVLYTKIYKGGDPLYEFYRTIEPLYVGQKELDNDKPAISFYPNPAHKIITIKNQNRKIEAVKIFNMHGQQILIEANLFNKDYKVNLNNIIPGNYIVQIFTSSDVYSEKLTVY